MKIFKVVIVVFLFTFFGCSSDDSSANNVSGGDPSCSDIEAEGQAVVCTLKSPIQETGFECPMGTPYLFEFDGAVVCSEDPALRTDQRNEVLDGDAEECVDDSSQFCVSIAPNQERLDDCESWVDSFTCLSEKEQEAIANACESAAVGAATEDWTDLSSCFEASNSFDGPDDQCRTYSGCVGSGLRVCHAFNDECWNLRDGRGGFCDNFVGRLPGCADEATINDLSARCDNAVDTATDEEWSDIESCLSQLNSDQCTSQRDCATAELANF